MFIMKEIKYEGIEYEVKYARNKAYCMTLFLDSTERLSGNSEVFHILPHFTNILLSPSLKSSTRMIRVL